MKCSLLKSRSEPPGAGLGLGGPGLLTSAVWGAPGEVDSRCGWALGLQEHHFGWPLTPSPDSEASCLSRVHGATWVQPGSPRLRAGRPPAAWSALASWPVARGLSSSCLLLCIFGTLVTTGHDVKYTPARAALPSEPTARPPPVPPDPRAELRPRWLSGLQSLAVAPSPGASAQPLPLPPRPRWRRGARAPPSPRSSSLHAGPATARPRVHGALAACKAPL